MRATSYTLQPVHTPSPPPTDAPQHNVHARRADTATDARPSPDIGAGGLCRSHPDLEGLDLAKRDDMTSAAEEQQGRTARPARLFHTHSWPPSARALTTHGKAKDDFWQSPECRAAPEQDPNGALQISSQDLSTDDRLVEPFPNIEHLASAPNLTPVEHTDLQGPRFRPTRGRRSTGLSSAGDRYLEVPASDTTVKSCRRDSIKADNTDSWTTFGVDEKKKSWVSHFADKWTKGRWEKHKAGRRLRHEEKIQADHTASFDRPRKTSTSRDNNQGKDVKDKVREDQRKKEKKSTPGREKDKDKGTGKTQGIGDFTNTSKDRKDDGTGDIATESVVPRPQKPRTKKINNPPHELSMTPLEALELERGRQRGEYFSGFSSKGEILYTDRPHTRYRHRTSSGRRSVWLEPGTLIRPVVEESNSSKSKLSKDRALAQVPPDRKGLQPRPGDTLDTSTALIGARRVSHSSTGSTRANESMPLVTGTSPPKADASLRASTSRSGGQGVSSRSPGTAELDARLKAVGAMDKTAE